MEIPKGLISFSTAAIICITVPTILVSSFYIFPNKRKLPRDSVEVIKKRIQSSIISSIISTAIVRYTFNDYSLKVVGTWMGFTFTNFLPSVLISTVLTTVLFIGPIWVDYKQNSLWNNCTCTWINFRNIIIGPVIEELLFRSCMVPVLVAGGLSQTAIIFGSPLLFGIAHLHHMIENIKNGGTFQNALAIAVLQLTYTSLFGFFATFLFFQTGNVISCIVSHMICNYIGLPDLSFWENDPHLRGMGATLYITGLIVFSILTTWYCTYTSLYPLFI
ncbi:hypothetical protein BC833DRAFT_397536 [Globomyces pollinis-pini]|nr:hypothetical protein BC833DRAFT_397536 [Globomyces pollinis-pini]